MRIVILGLLCLSYGVAWGMDLPSVPPLPPVSPMSVMSPISADSVLSSPVVMAIAVKGYRKGCCLEKVFASKKALALHARGCHLPYEDDLRARIDRQRVRDMLVHQKNKIILD